MSRTLLIVEDEDTLRESLARLFTKEGMRVDSARSAEDALALLQDNTYDVLVSDIILPGMDGLDMLERLRAMQVDTACIIMTAYASLETAVKALKAGAYDYIMKPILHEEIKQVVRNAAAHKYLKRENTRLKQELADKYDFSLVIGEGGSLKSIIDEARKVADSTASVLLLGETGTGKELLARVIHSRSARAELPFVAINCSSIPEGLLESELFGHVRGAFTGAGSNKPGLMEEADGGTIFLDEIGDMPHSIQAKLLRVLQDFEIRPVGSTKSKKIDVRLIAATNKDLQAAVASGAFREDLYYRINVITLKLPSLRQRKEDLPNLVEHYLKRYCARQGVPAKHLAPVDFHLLLDYHWPGNIRELQNVLERAVLISDGQTITKDHLPMTLKAPGPQGASPARGDLSIEDYTRAFILSNQAQYSEQELADKLGITRKTLWEKRKKWGIKRQSSTSED